MKINSVNKTSDKMVIFFIINWVMLNRKKKLKAKNSTNVKTLKIYLLKWFGSSWKSILSVKKE